MTKFNRRNELEGESAEQYIMELYKLAESCNYGDMETKMICDRLVVGIREILFSRHLQLHADLTLQLDVYFNINCYQFTNEL